ncbi:NAD(P)-binding domain-containing protein [Allokutzneria oryzae]|uniref:NAD(P)-binding domain-containing protein n=1 Tax=Allokutzneria oryzae TaxID=1378989 RepID=A0ABV6AA28_9PSEU
MISSRSSTQFPDHPMPSWYPDFPSRLRTRQYLASYAEVFGLDRHIELDTEVLSAVPCEDRFGAPGWTVLLRADGRQQTRRYRTVTVANGHTWSPRRVRHPGQFSGVTTRSDEYWDASVSESSRVLVIGCGNTGCDIAVDAGRAGTHSSISMRSGTWFFPKTFLGVPLSDVPTRMPAWLRLAPLEWAFGRVVLRLAVGDLRRFVDGTSADFDVVVYATGYRIDFPMLAPELVDGQPVLCARTASPRHRGLFFPGIGQARTGGGPLYQEAGYLCARMIAHEAGSRRGVVEDLVSLLRGRLRSRLVRPADTRSRGLGAIQRDLRLLTWLLDRVGAPGAESRRADNTQSEADFQKIDEADRLAG